MTTIVCPGCQSIYDDRQSQCPQCGDSTEYSAQPASKRDRPPPRPWRPPFPKRRRSPATDS